MMVLRLVELNYEVVVLWLSFFLSIDLVDGS